jgi:VIT1/CCC1 family predicted Fe2+/Mn2+ transporter
LRAAVLGGTDGLTSNLALVMGVAGADPGRGIVLLTGIAGLIAGSFSMALGEWISVTSSRESAELLLATERKKIELMPDAVQDELALIYRAKGIPEQHARELAQHLMADPEHVLKTLATEELGIVPGELGSPAVASFMSAISFAAGAAMPLIPFLFVVGLMAIGLSTLVAAIGLFAVGSLITVLTPHSSLYGGARQVVLGLFIAAITYGIGSLIGEATGL